MTAYGQLPSWQLPDLSVAQTLLSILQHDVIMGLTKQDIACIIGLFLGAFFLRMYALTYLPVRPITDDAFEYNYIAQNLPGVLSNEVPDNRESFLYLSAKRGLLYPSFIAAVYKLFGQHPRHVLLLQVLIDSLSCVLVYALGRTVFNKKAGVLAAILAILYPAFPYYATMLFQETTTIFLLTLFLLILSTAISQKKTLLYCISGLLAAALSFYRSGFLLLMIFTTPVLFFIARLYYQRDRVRPCIYYCVGALCLLILYGAFSYRITGSVMLNKPSVAWGIYETTHRDGWPSDTFAPTPTAELREAARGYSYPIMADAHQLGLPPRIYIMATLRYIQKQPLAYLSQIITRCKRMWAYVETYPGKWHSKTVWGQLIFHRVLIVLALVGIPLSMAVWHHSLLFIAIFLYLTIAYIPTIGLPRYAVPAMPFVIILAAYASLRLLNIIARERKRLVSFPGAFLCGAVMSTALLAFYLDVPMLLAVFPHAPPPLLHIMTIVIMNGLCIAAAILLYWLIAPDAPMRSLTVCAAAVSLLVVMILYTNDALTSKTWQEWQTCLYSTQQKIKQTIVLPENFNSDLYREAYVVIDMFPGGGQNYSFHVEVNGKPVKRYHAGIKSKAGKFDKQFFGLYKSLLFDAYRLSPEDLRQWYEVELPLSFLKDRSQLVIDCSVDGTTDHKKNYVMLFGDYPTGDEHVFKGPCIPRSDEDTSLIKIMPYSGDYRFEKVTPLHSRETVSAYYNGLEWLNSDLSGVRGTQSGSYRIRVELIGKDGTQVVL